MSFFSKIFLISIFIFSLSVNVYSATGPEEISELKEKVYYNVSPSKPNIGDVVEIEAEMFGTDIKNSTFLWKINNKTVEERVGLNKFNFTLSEKTKIDLIITTGAGVIIERSFDFDPKKVVIVWEARTYTPPFYKGKSFHAKESNLFLTAINIDQENPLTNIKNNYVWRVDSTVKGDSSGVGYNTYVHRSDILGTEPLFSVTMSNTSTFKEQNKDTFNSQSILRVQALPTEIISYEKTPLLGVLFNKTIKSNFNLTKNETTLVSYPLNYSFSSSLSGIYEWYVNNSKVNIYSNELSFKKTKDNDQSSLTLTIKNLSAILQTNSVSYIVDTTKN